MLCGLHGPARVGQPLGQFFDTGRTIKHLLTLRPGIRGHPGLVLHALVDTHGAPIPAPIKAGEQEHGALFAGAAETVAHVVSPRAIRISINLARSADARWPYSAP